MMRAFFARRSLLIALFLVRSRIFVGPYTILKVLAPSRASQQADLKTYDSD